MWTAALLLAMAATGVRVEGATSCPTPAEVDARLRALLPVATVANAEADVVQLADAEGGLLIRLVRPDGATIGERVIERAFPCLDLAAASALVVATWESDVHPEFAAPVEAAPPAPQPPAPAPAAQVVSSAAGPAARSSWSLGAGALGSLAPDGAGVNPAGGLWLEAAWLGARGRAGARLVALATTDRELALGSGDVAWRRVTARGGATLRLTPPAARVAFDLHADALVAWLSIKGSGFPTNHDADALDAGLGVGGRLAVAGALGPWIELGANAWPRPQVVFEQATGGSTQLPRWEAYLALGVSTGLGP